MDKKKGWIIYNGNLGTGKFLDIVKWLNRVAQENNLDTTLVKNNDLIITIENGISTIKGKYANQYPDFIIFWDKDIRLANHLEKMGLKLYNSADSIDICDDKSITYQVLADNNIPTPKTIIGPKIFNRLGVIDFSSYDYIINELGFPMILKESHGSFGAQVYMIENKDELLEKVKQLRGTPLLFQEFISSSYGKDVRIHVVGDEVVASMLRVSETDFRANISAGGKMYKYTPSNEEKDLAIRCSKLVGTDFAGIDLLFGENGNPIVCEVNSNAHFINIYNCTGIDISQSIIKYIKKDLGVE